MASPFTTTYYPSEPLRRPRIYPAPGAPPAPRPVVNYRSTTGRRPLRSPSALSTAAIDDLATIPTAIVPAALGTCFKVPVREASVTLVPMHRTTRQPRCRERRYETPWPAEPKGGV